MTKIGRPVKYDRIFVESLLKEMMASTISLKGICKQKKIYHMSIVKAMQRYEIVHPRK